MPSFTSDYHFIFVMLLNDEDFADHFSSIFGLLLCELIADESNDPSKGF